jgi:hypothetical protein
MKSKIKKTLEPRKVDSKRRIILPDSFASPGDVVRIQQPTANRIIINRVRVKLVLIDKDQGDSRG